MTGWPDRPVVYEVNTAGWLDELSRAAGRPVTLADVADADWDAVTPAGADAVWLMGGWERSPAGLALAKANPELLESFRAALPSLRMEDIIGSPYCVRRYVADDRFGGRPGLAAARAALAARGVRLVLDYAPNPPAPDPPRVSSQPDFFGLGDAGDVSPAPAARRKFRASPRPGTPTYESPTSPGQPAPTRRSTSIPLFQPMRWRPRRPCRTISAAAAIGCAAKYPCRPPEGAPGRDCDRRPYRGCAPYSHESCGCSKTRAERRRLRANEIWWRRTRSHIFAYADPGKGYLCHRNAHRYR